MTFKSTTSILNEVYSGSSLNVYNFGSTADVLNTVLTSVSGTSALRVNLLAGGDSTVTLNNLELTGNLTVSGNTYEQDQYVINDLFVQTISSNLGTGLTFEDDIVMSDNTMDVVLKDLYDNSPYPIRISGGTFVGYPFGTSTPIPIVNDANTSYALTLTDANSYLRLNNGGTITVTIPANSGISFTSGTTITMEQTGAGVINVAQHGDVTLNGDPNTDTQFHIIQIIKVATDIWTAIGGVV